MPTYSTTNAPLPWMEPYLQDYMSRAQDQANTPYEQGPGTYTGPNDLMRSGWQATANRAVMGSQEMSAGRNQLTNTINGGYLNDNPYLQTNIDNAQGDLARNFNLVNKPAWDKAMQSSGSFGNTGVAEMAGNDRNNLMQNMGRIGSDMRGANYNNERGRQMTAMSMAPQYANQDYTDLNNLMNVGKDQQGFQQGYQNQQNQFFNDRRNYGQQQLDNYGRALGTNVGGSSTQQAPGTSTASGVVGGAAAGMALYDEFMKWMNRPPQG